MNYQRITDVPAVADLAGSESIYIRQGDKFAQVPVAAFTQALGIENGKDGISPAVSVATIAGGHRITITDADGAKTVDVLNGQPGDDGVTPNLQIGTVTTLPAGSPATAKITGTAANPVLSLGLPRGEDAAGGTAGVISINNLSGDVTLPVPGHCVCNSAASDKSKVLTSFSAGFDPSADGAILAVQFQNPSNAADGPKLQIGQTTYTIVHPRNLTQPAASALKKSVHHFSMRGSTRSAILLDPYVSTSTIEVDATLSQSGQAADAKAAGDMIKQVRDKLTSGKEALAGTSLTLQDPEDGDRGVRFDVDPKISDETGAPIAQRLSIYGIYGDEPVRLGNIYDPAGPQDAATKGYVDAAIDTISAGSGTGGGGVDVLVDDTLQEAAAYTFQGPGAADTYRRIIIDIACTAQEANVNTTAATIFGNTIATYYINAATKNNRKTTIALEIINSNTAIFQRSSINTNSADPMNATTYSNVDNQLIVTTSINAEKPLLRIPAELPTGTRIRIMGVRK